MCTVASMKKPDSAGAVREARVELADNLELAVVVEEQRLCARLSPGTARRLAGVLMEFAQAREPSFAMTGHAPHEAVAQTGV